MEKINDWLSVYANWTWGLPTLALLVLGGLFFMVYSRFLPFRYIGHAIQVLRGKYDDPNAHGQITHFQALTTALSATIGMGNIAGVAVAITIGGPGAIFWLWVSGIIGMATKFFTSTLAILYRGKDSVGEIQGGPMYFIVEGLGKNWKPLAIFFSLAGLIGALPVFNVNQLTQAIQDILIQNNEVEINGFHLANLMSGLVSFDPNLISESLPQLLIEPNKFYSNLAIGIVLAVITSIVILGGLKRISETASKLVPSMVLIYFVSVVGILILNYEEVPRYFMMIFQDAFTAESFINTAANADPDIADNAQPFLGGMLGGLILLGIRRGAFSNEAGIGTAPMAHGAAKTSEPVREGLVAMLGPMIDTLIVCTLTALAILVTGVWQSPGAQGVSLTAEAFSNSYSTFGNYLLLLCVAVFSISSLFSYSYYGTKCMSFLFGAKNKHIYNYFYIASIIVGATYSLDSILNLIDGTFALMAFPTMIATLIMAPRVMKEAKKYFAKMKSKD